jgi:hypothetical protein
LILVQYAEPVEAGNYCKDTYIRSVKVAPIDHPMNCENSGLGEMMILNEEKDGEGE